MRLLVGRVGLFGVQIRPVIPADLHHEVGEISRELWVAHHLPLGRQQLHVPLDVEELLADQHQFARQLDVVDVGQFRQLLADVGVGHVAQGLHGEWLGERLQVLGGLGLGLDRPHRAQQYDDLAGGGMVLLDQQRVDQFTQQPAGPRVDAAHDAEVQEHDASRSVDQQVAGVQVAVEQPVPQPALERREQQGLDQFGAVEPLFADRGDVIDAHAVDALHGQHPLGGELPVHVGHLDVLAQRRTMQSAVPGLHGLCLEAEVELLGEVVGEVGDHVLRRETPAQLGELDDLGEAPQDLQVGGDPAADTRPLDLHDDVLAAVQGGEMHLGDGRRGERPLLEVLEQLGGLGTEFLGEQLVHFGGVSRWHGVEQAAELARHGLTEGTRAGRDDLSELDVGGPQVGEGLRDLPDDLRLPGDGRHAQVAPGAGWWRRGRRYG